jgi:glycosyltransferase involved in cell wall biosynthesis
MIVKDEEANLTSCLNSVTDVVDEIVIVDTGSRDNTVSIAESFGAKIFYHEWEDNFSAPRNISLDHATGDWIFILDADEVLAQESKAGLRYLTKNEEKLGYYVLMQLHPQWTEGRRFSLFRNHLRLRYHGIFHEELLIPDHMKSRIGFSDVKIIHMAWDEDNQKRKLARNISLLKKHLSLYPDSIYQMLDLIRLYLESENLAAAEELLARVLTLFSQRKPDENSYKYHLAHYLLYLFQLQLLSKKRIVLEKIIPLCEEAISLFPSCPLFLYEAALMYYKLKVYDRAVSYFKQCLSLGENNSFDRTMIFPKDILGPKSLTGLGYCYFKKRDYAEALRYFERSYKLHEDTRIKAMIQACRHFQEKRKRRETQPAS